jgi:reverse gyrase
VVKVEENKINNKADKFIKIFDDIDSVLKKYENELTTLEMFGILETIKGKYLIKVIKKSQ